MPTFAIVDGMKLKIHVNDHPPPHFHVEAGDYEALISIATGDILEGALPRARQATLRRWFWARQEMIAYWWVEIQNHRLPGGLIT